MKTNNYTVTINGFVSKKQAMAFATWLSEQGEQDFQVWADISEVDGISVDTFRYADKNVAVELK